MHLSYLIASVVVICVARFLQICYQSITSPLRDIPGPFLARYTRLWYLNKLRTGQAHHENIALHRKYAPPDKFYADVVRLGPDLYSITQPDKVVYGIGSKMPKSDWYEGWKHPDPDRWTLFPDQNIARHAETRRKFQSIYALSSLVSYETYVDSCAEIFQRRMSEAATNGHFINMAHWFQCYAFDVIGDITYGKRFGFLNAGLDVGGTIGALNRAMFYGTLIGVYAWAHPIVYRIMEKIPGTGAAGRNYIMGFVRDRVAAREVERKSSDVKVPQNEDGDVNTPRDFLDKIMDLREDETKKVTSYHVFMMGMSNIIAGSDTTAVSLSSVLYNLIRYPRTMRGLRKELEIFEQQGSYEMDRISFKDSQRMTYLQACIKEALRLHSATGLPLWRVVPQGGAEVCGRFFPGGSTVGINTWVAHYDQDIWGSDAQEFRPERWIEAELEGGTKLKTMESFYMPFGLGSRTCIGRHISYLEMCKLVPQLVRKFDFELETPNQQWTTENFWFVKPVDFRVKVKPRIG